MSKPLHQILIRPLLTEKSVRQTQAKKYMFEVAMDASKIEIAQAVEELFSKEKVKVDSVNTLHMRGKTRRMNLRRGRRPSVGTSPAWKKAIVTLTTDSPNIPLLEGA
jgi:large subunit ribosomal protein L23